jgi:PAS domain S-box-containing protein
MNPSTEGRPSPAAQGTGDLASLVRQLRAAEEALNTASAGEVDSLVLGDGQVYLLRKAQQDLRDSEARFRQLFEESPDPIFVEDAGGHVIDANEAACDLHGYPRWELIGKHFSELVPPESRDGAVQGWQAMFESEHADFTSMSLAKDGRLLPVEVKTSRIHYSGRPALLLHVRDITVHRRAQQTAAEAERFARAALDALTANIAILDEHGVILRVNQAWADEAAANSVGPISQGEGTNYLEACTEAAKRAMPVLGELVAGIQAVIANLQREYVLEYPCPVDATQRWFVVRVTRFPGDGPCRVVVAHTDTTVRKRMQLRSQEQAALLDRASDAIIVRDMEHRVLYWNKGAERIYGWKDTEVVGQKIAPNIMVDAEDHRAAVAHLMEKGDWMGELRQRTKSGSEVVLQARWTLVRDDLGLPQSVLLINTDITEKKRLEAQFLRAQRIESIGNLASGVAHDLNNVLAPILMSVSLLRSKVPPQDADSRKFLDMLEANAQRGAHLVRQVLGFGRGYEGARILVQPGHIVREVGDIIADTFPKSISFEHSIPRDTWTILGDPTQLHQILLNLSVNARDAMPAGGHLKIALSNENLDQVFAGMNPGVKAGRHVLVTVSDTGHGIPRAIQDRIFEPFFTTKEVGRGTGLGLSTVHALVKSHGGFLNLYSEEGKGTTFRLYFPASENPEAAEEPGAADAGLPRGNNELILVADDEEPIRIATEKTLVEFGYRVLAAENGAVAVSLYALHRDEIAAVLTDMAMPVMDGHATIVAIRNINPKVKVIGSSGIGSGTQRNPGGGPMAPIEHFISKPYVAETLLRKLHALLHSGSRPPVVPGGSRPPMVPSP